MFINIILGTIVIPCCWLFFIQQFLFLHCMLDTFRKLFIFRMWNINKYLQLAKRTVTGTVCTSCTNIQCEEQKKTKTIYNFDCDNRLSAVALNNLQMDCAIKIITAIWFDYVSSTNSRFLGLFDIRTNKWINKQNGVGNRFNSI